MSELLGNYAPFILGAMGATLFLMLIEPILLIIKRRLVLQDVKRVIRLEQRRKRNG